MPGVSLDEIPQDTRIEVLKNALNRIKKEVRTLSQHHIKTEDIGGDNILFSDHIALIDLELGLKVIPEGFIKKKTYYTEEQCAQY